MPILVPVLGTLIGYQLAKKVVGVGGVVVDTVDNTLDTAVTTGKMAKRGMEISKFVVPVLVAGGVYFYLKSRK